MKAAIVVLSDPNANSEEALGRVFNGLAAAYELKQNGDEVTVVFQGAGTRWLKQLSAPDHPVHELFELVKDRVAGASAACATIFGATEDVAAIRVAATFSKKTGDAYVDGSFSRRRTPCSETGR